MPYLYLLMIIVIQLAGEQLRAQPLQLNSWYTLLPTCPCKNPDFRRIQLGDGWAKDKGNIQKYHSGSAECVRSYPYTKTSAGKSGQQCCYDYFGNLIKAGRAAGTPDKISTCAGETDQGVMRLQYTGLVGHYFKDVRPWKKAGPPNKAWIIYNQSWPPDSGKGCPN